MPTPRRPIAARLHYALGARIVPRPSHRHTLLSRVVLRASGAPRRWLPEGWKGSVMHRLLVNWLTDTQGIAVSDGRVHLAPPWGGDAALGPAVLIREEPATGTILLRERDAAVIAGGEDRLVARLVDHPDAIVAYGDAIYTDAEGRVSGHWLKPPRTDPLLAAQGLLLTGLVAIAGSAPGKAALLDALRSGSRLQAAMAAFAADLHAASCVHCAAPVVVCAPPVPLAAAPPSLSAPRC